MSALRSILVHADASPQCAVRLQLAEQLARAHGAAATALYAVSSSLTQYPMALAAGADIAPVLAEVDAQRATAARQAWAATVSPEWVAWVEGGGGPPIAETIRHALAADLVLLGQRGVGAQRDVDVPSDFVASVVIGSGRAALVLPYIATAPVALKRALIAWKATPESARAVSAALPLLQQADSVEVVGFDEGDAAADEAGIVGYLRLHGVTARFSREAAFEHDLGAQLLSLAADRQAELLVMGCYGHGRAREWALGGASRSVLASMTLPVLMAH